jgi:hypothetical protein
MPLSGHGGNNQPVKTMSKINLSIQGAHQKHSIFVQYDASWHEDRNFINPLVDDIQIEDIKYIDKNDRRRTLNIRSISWILYDKIIDLIIFESKFLQERAA